LYNRKIEFVNPVVKQIEDEYEDDDEDDDLPAVFCSSLFISFFFRCNWPLFRPAAALKRNIDLDRITGLTGFFIS